MKHCFPYRIVLLLATTSQIARGMDYREHKEEREQRENVSISFAIEGIDKNTQCWAQAQIMKQLNEKLARDIPGILYEGSALFERILLCTPHPDTGKPRAGLLRNVTPTEACEVLDGYMATATLPGSIGIKRDDIVWEGAQENRIGMRFKPHHLVASIIKGLHEVATQKGVNPGTLDLHCVDTQFRIQDTSVTETDSGLTEAGVIIWEKLKLFSTEYTALVKNVLQNNNCFNDARIGGLELYGAQGNIIKKVDFITVSS